MTEKEYRDLLKSNVWQYRLGTFLNEIKDGNFDHLLNTIRNPTFSRDASVGELYKFQWELVSLYSMMNGCVKEIKNSHVLESGEFDDHKMTFADIGIHSNQYECVTSFKYDDHMEVLPGTIIELLDLHWANHGNRVSIIFSTLVANAPKKIMDAFSSGIEAIISLKVLGDNFKPK